PLVHRHGGVAAAVQKLVQHGVGLGHLGGLGLGQFGFGRGGLVGGKGGGAGQSQSKSKSANGADGAPEKLYTVPIHGSILLTGGRISGSPVPIVEAGGGFVKNRRFVLPSFCKPVTDWPYPSACAGG